MTLPSNPNRGVMSASNINVELGMSATSKLVFGQSAYRNLVGYSVGAVTLEDAYGKPYINGTGIVATYTITNTSIAISISGIIDAYTVYNYYLFDHTNGVVGLLVQVQENSTSLSKTFYNLTTNGRYLVLITRVNNAGTYITSKDITVIQKTIPPVPSLVGLITDYQSIQGTLTPASSPISGLPDYQSITIYNDMPNNSSVQASAYISNSNPFFFAFYTLPSNSRYWVFGYVSNSAGYTYISQRNIWTKSTTITTKPTAYSTIILSGTSSNRTVSWSGGSGAALFDIYIWGYPTFSPTYYSGTVSTNSISGITNIPAGTKIYIYISAENYLGTTTSSLQTTN